jgi:hypothetical protein
MEIQCLSCNTTLKKLFCICDCGKTFIQRGKIRSSCGFKQGIQPNQHQHQTQHQYEQKLLQKEHTHQGWQKLPMQ